MKLFQLLICQLVVVTSCFATQWNSDGSSANIQSIHDTQAANGDTITLPVGSFTWTTGVTISKNITLQGAGTSSTTVSSTNLSLLNLGVSTSVVTGIHFVINGVANTGAFITVRGQNFRIHHNIFESLDATGLVSRQGVICTGGTGVPHPTGVIDHNQFFNAKFLIQGNLDLMGNAIWNQPSKIGNPDQTGVVYVEDNYFYRDSLQNDCADADYSGRYVFRYNDVHNCQVEMHSTRGLPAGRGGKSWEVYNNTFTRDISGTQFNAIWERNGTGVIYNNTITGAFDHAILLDNVRSFTLFGYPPGSCDGTSDWDGNTGAFGYPCRDQVGRGSDTAPWTSTPPPQASEKVYIWGNTLNGAPADTFIHNTVGTIKPNGSAADIVFCRDYTSDPRPGYSAYTYPHPLTIAPSPTPTPTATATATFTPTVTPTFTPTATATSTPIPTATATFTPTPTPIASPTCAP